MKEDAVASSLGQALHTSSKSREDDDDGDVLRQVPLPGWSIFDALFISWHDHPQAETSGGAFTDTPIARIQKFRRWFMIIVGGLLLLSAIAKVLSHFSSAPSTTSTLQAASQTSPGRLSSLFGWRSGSSVSTSKAAALAGYPLSAAYFAALYNASSIPARIRPSSSRMAMLQAIAKSRSSSYDPADFILNHREIVEHANTGGDPLDLITKKSSTGEQAPTLRPYSVSAIIVHSPDYDISSTQLIVSMAVKYPFIREIMIWNNDIGFYINENTIQVPTVEDLGFLPPSLRVLNSPSSFAPLSSPIHRRLPASRAKHLACGLASKEFCLFLSPAFLPIHLDTSYSTYLNTGPEFSQIVAVTNAGDYYRTSHLRFENDEMDLHAGIVQAGIDLGSNIGNKDGKQSAKDAEMQECFVNRKWSRRFMHQLETLTPEMHGEEADIYWSLWMNTYPKILTAPALAIHDDTPTPRTRASPAQLQQARDIVALSAVRTLYNTLAAQDPFLSPDPFPIAPSPPLDEARAPCHDDRCLFETNITPFTRTPASLTFSKAGQKQQKASGRTKQGLQQDQGRNPRKANSGSAFNPYLHVQSMGEYQDAWHASTDVSSTGGFPTTMADFQRSSNWYLAVNGRLPSIKTLANNATTCWLTPGNLDKGSYFGLNLLAPKRVRSIKLTASLNLGNIVARGQEDLTAESWEIWTKDVPDSKAGIESSDVSVWTRRALRGRVISTRIGDSALYEHSLALAPTASGYRSIVDADAAPESNVDGQLEILADIDDEEDDQILRKRALNQLSDVEDEDESQNIGEDGSTIVKPRALMPVDQEDIEEGTKIEGIRFISRDHKSQPVRICGFDIDGWIV